MKVYLVDLNAEYKLFCLTDIGNFLCLNFYSAGRLCHTMAN